MTNTAKAQYSFFSAFGLPAYMENAVPDQARPPYITYQLIAPRWDSPAQIYARVWYRSSTMEEINAKVDQIANAIGGGVSVPAGSGFLLIYKDSPFAQRMAMEGDVNLQCIYLRMILHAFTD